MVQASTAAILFLPEVFGLYTCKPEGLSLEWGRRDLKPIYSININLLVLVRGVDEAHPVWSCYDPRSVAATCEICGFLCAITRTLPGSNPYSVSLNPSYSQAQLSNYLQPA